MTQLQQVKFKLQTEGAVSRNWAIKNYITRLGALINRLKKAGWNIEGRYLGKDYVYKVKKETMKDKLSDLNNELIKLLRESPITWDGKDRIEEIQKALKSKFPETKQRVIKRYS